jgi:hypothetical protein
LPDRFIKQDRVLRDERYVRAEASAVDIVNVPATDQD